MGLAGLFVLQTVWGLRWYNFNSLRINLDVYRKIYEQEPDGLVPLANTKRTYKTYSI